ncbi:alkyl hydroperoxide reductase and/or thiol-specific antioxidant family (AhpC/TSA) protein [Nonlabens ulvanivorans]|nr:thioredoxin family protein [Nonlabens ulvanivorans]GAK91203.1 alkyl hydroperoxide reductase and/or thiol-specific antioxidant family (AhpC/TSA) protein [Nonlabens ulvanivorans]
MKTLKILTAVAVVALVGILASGILNFGTMTKEDIEIESAINDVQLNEQAPIKKGYEIGDKATDFSLMNIDGKMISLKDYDNAKGYIIIFTCNHCPYSVAYEDRIIALDKEFKEQGYPVIAINPNNPEAYPEDSYDNMKIRAKEKDFTFPYLFDAGQKIYPQYGATKTPHVFLLQKEGADNIVKYIGAIDDNHKDAKAIKNDYLRNAVTDLINGQEIKMTKTVAIGCSIKS